MAASEMGWSIKVVSPHGMQLALGLALALLIFPAEARAQAPAQNAAAISGQVAAPTGQVAVSAQVHICPITASQAPCTPQATLYSNAALTVQTQNPVLTDQYGNYKVFVTAGLYLVQVYISPAVGPVYTYYVSAGTASTAAGSVPPPYSIQFASTTAGAFASDPTIFINPSAHILETPELFVPGTGTGLIGITGGSSGSTVYQTVNAATSGWTFTWPTGPPGSGTNCLTAASPGVSSWQSCILSGNYLPLTGGTLAGPGTLVGTGATFNSVTSATVNMVVNVALDPTAGDIGAKITHAATATPCNAQCTLYVPAGNYAQTTTIVLPMNNAAVYALQCDPGAVFSYSGTADWLDGVVSTSAPTTSDMHISGCTVIGTSAATAGIHLQPTNTVRIDHMLLEGFFSGPAIWGEGINAAWITDNLIANNLNGIEMSPTYCSGATCGTGVSGNGYTPNAIHILNNTIVHNSDWAVWFADPVNGALTGALNDEISGNDLELNGSGGSAYGAVSVGRSTGMVISKNYFEGSPRQVVLGLTSGAVFFSSQGPVVRDNYFTEETATPYSIELVNTSGALIEGNSTLDGTQNSSNCFINGTPYVPASTGGELATVVGQNYVLLSGGGSYLCENGVGVGALAGAGSYQQVNSNIVMQLVNSNYAIVSSGTTDTGVAVSGNINVGSGCLVGPYNSAAIVPALSSTFVVTGAGVGTLTHPSGAIGARLNIFCVP